ncbi:hypothetical protein [Fischerella sp. PCC 9605]|uniref:hypothetical protein n=1 Tax=Fischerella sp. PCC 9605 TaxID=1173024 RepID=UPI0004B25984|nr:hypothetical protein [Fischerella sp. PCC 9605]
MTVAPLQCHCFALRQKTGETMEAIAFQIKDELLPAAPARFIGVSGMTKTLTITG